MAQIKIKDRHLRKKKERLGSQIEKKVKKIKKMKPDVTKEEIQEEISELQIKYEELKTTYQIDYLNMKEMIVLDGMLRNIPRKELAQQLDMSLPGVYYISRTPEFQKAFQAEMTQKFADMKKSRKAYYVKIAEKGLSILLDRLDKIEEEQAKGEWSGEKSKDIIAIIDKVIDLMATEDGTKGTNVNITGGMDNTNVIAEVKEFDLADAEFRQQFKQILVNTDDGKPIGR